MVTEELRLPAILWNVGFKNLLVKNDPASLVISGFFNEKMFKYIKTHKVNIQLKMIHRCIFKDSVTDFNIKFKQNCQNKACGC